MERVNDRAALTVTQLVRSYLYSALLTWINQNRLLRLHPVKQEIEDMCQQIQYLQFQEIQIFYDYSSEIDDVLYVHLFLEGEDFKSEATNLNNE